MAARPKPYEVNRTNSSSSFRVSSTVANGRNMPDVPESPNTISTPVNGTSIHIGGGRNINAGISPSTALSTSSPNLPPRPGSLSSPYSSASSPYSSYGSSPYGSSYGSSYGSRYGSSPYGSSTYGSSYGSSYGSPYGSSYGSRYGGSSYGGYGSSYGSSYGGYGGYSRYGSGYGQNMGMPGDPRQQQGPMGGIMQSGYNQINRIGQVVEGFTRFSHLLDANFDAMHGSFSSIIRMIDVFGEFMYVIRTFAIFRFLSIPISTLWRIISGSNGKSMKQIGPNEASSNFSLSDFSSFKKGEVQPFQSQQPRKQRGIMYLFMIAISCLSAPMLLLKLWDVFQKRRRIANKEGAIEGVWSTEDEMQMEKPRMLPASNVKARALYDFMGENEMDLTFRRDEVITVLDRPFPDWWEGQTIDGRKGLFPQNFVQVIED